MKIQMREIFRFLNCKLINAGSKEDTKLKKITTLFVRD